MPLEQSRRPDLQMINQVIGNNLNYPPEFKVDIHPDPSVPLDSEEIYRTALGVMYDISAFPLDYAWLDRTWASSRGGPSIHLAHRDFGGKDPSQMYNQFTIWGLNHLMLSITLTTGYCRTVAVLTWQGVEVGSIYIAKSESSSLFVELPWDGDTGDIRNESSREIVRRDPPPPPPPPSANLTADEDVEVLIDYVETRPIDRKLVYLTGLKAMGEAAEKSLYRPVQELLTKGFRGVNWKLVGGSGAFEGVFRPAHSRLAVMKVMAAMIRDQAFQTTHVWIKVDGKNTAAGGLSAGELLAAS
ncbi:MAG: hypothetical protein Q9216_005027 [Gyalolechia sp. 2 TL-2023]